MDEKDTTEVDKYDRQIRLWGSLGQKRLANSVVILFGAKSIGCETVKNLVLPGIGEVIVVDDEEVASEGEPNYFIDALQDVGKPRGAAVRPRLAELNPDARVCCLSTEEIKKKFCDTRDNYSELACVLCERERFADIGVRIAAMHRVPLVEYSGAGWFGCFRIMKELPHIVVNSGDENMNNLKHALFLADPYLSEIRELSDLYWNREDLSDGMVYAHIPWPFILIKAVDEWRNSLDSDGSGQKHGDELRIPKTMDEKNGLKKIIKKLQGNKDGMCWEEAMKHVHLMSIDIRELVKNWVENLETYFCTVDRPQKEGCRSEETVLSELLQAVVYQVASLYAVLTASSVAICPKLLSDIRLVCPVSSSLLELPDLTRSLPNLARLRHQTTPLLMVRANTLRSYSA